MLVTFKDCNIFNEIKLHLNKHIFNKIKCELENDKIKKLLYVFNNLIHIQYSIIINLIYIYTNKYNFTRYGVITKLKNKQ